MVGCGGGAERVGEEKVCTSGVRASESRTRTVSLDDAGSSRRRCDGWIGPGHAFDAAKLGRAVTLLRSPVYMSTPRRVFMRLARGILRFLLFIFDRVFF